MIVFQVFLPNLKVLPTLLLLTDLSSNLSFLFGLNTQSSLRRFCFQQQESFISALDALLISVSERKVGYKLVIGRSLANERWVSQSDLPLVVVFGFR